MSDIVSRSVDEVTFDHLVSFSTKECWIFDFEWFFIFFFIFFYDIFWNLSAICDDVVELTRIDKFFDRVYEIDDFHIGGLSTFGHSVTHVDDFSTRFMECFAHPFREEIRDDARIEISRTDDDIVSIKYRLTSARIDIAFISFEPCIDDILVDIV